MRGFTILELVLTISVLAVMSVIAVPFFTDVGAGTADAAAKKLVSDINYVRRMAQSRNGVYGISFDAATESYTAYLYTPATNTSTTLTDPHTQSPMVIDFDLSPGFRGVNLQSASLGGTTEVRFNSQGFPQNAANALLDDEGTIQLEGGDIPISIVIQPNTGEVSLQ